MARMSLPFLPLCPTGTDPPTPAAAAAMDEALGLPESEVVRTILTNLRAGDEEGAKEEACNAVSIWINLAKLHHRLDKEEAVWATLVRNVFPNAPWPAPLPVLTNKAWFYAMCKRHQLWSAAEQRYETLKDQLLAAKRRESDAEWGLWRFHGAYQAEELSTEPKLHSLWKKIERKLQRATYDRHQLEKEMTWFETHDLLDARERMQKWDVVPRGLRLQRQGAVPPERPESPLRPDDSSSSSSDDDDDAMEED